MDFPSSIHSPKLVGSAGLIARYEARTSTDQPAIVLVAPPADCGAVSLEAAHKALVVLRQDGLPFPGCPSMIDYQETPGGGALLVLGVRGAPLASAWPDEAMETDVLDLAIQHARLLKALHQAGFSGLQPAFEDLRWDTTHKSLMLLGWEWVPENDESQHEDLRAAAALWVELLTGAAPPLFPPLTPETKGLAWQRVSLGTRVLLSSILLDPQATTTAESTHTQLEAILKHWSQPVDELLSEGLDLLSREQFPAAQALLDLAARRNPDSVGSFRLRETQERATKRFVDIISDIRIGACHSAVNKLQRIQGDGATTVQERLRAWRWWTIAEALWRLEPGDQPDNSERLGQELLKVGLDVDRRQIKTALNHVQQALVGEETNRVLDGLRFLEADLRSCLLIEQATNLMATDLTTAADLFEQAEHELQKLSEPYCTALAAQLGDAAIGLEQVREKLADQELVRRTVNEARAALKADDLSLARQKWNDALRLADRSDPERVTIRQGLRRVQLRSQAVAAGVAGNPENMSSVEVSAVLHALSVLHTAFPRDTWGAAHAKRWQQALFTQLERDPTGPAGAWLVEHWPKAAGVKRSLEQAAPLALEGWNARVAEIVRDQELPKTPQRAGDLLHRLDNLLAELDRARQWITPTSRAEAFDVLRLTTLDSRMETHAIAAAQARLLMQFKAAVDIGVVPVSALVEAKQLGIELFDETDRSVANVLTQYYQPVLQSSAQLSILLGSIDAAWRANDTDLALVCCNLVIETPELPEHIRASVEAVSQSIRKGYKSPHMQTSDENDGGRYHFGSSGYSSDPMALQEIRQTLVNLSSSLEQLAKIVTTTPQSDEDDKLLRVKCMALDPSHYVRVNIRKIQEYVSSDAFVEAEDLLKNVKKQARPGPSKECAEQCERFLEHAKVKRKGVLLNRLSEILETEEAAIEADMVAEMEYALSVLQPLMDDSAVYRSLKNRCSRRMANQST